MVLPANQRIRNFSVYLRALNKGGSPKGRPQATDTQTDNPIPNELAVLEKEIS
jgi:hypothetical protein